MISEFEINFEDERESLLKLYYLIGDPNVAFNTKKGIKNINFIDSVICYDKWCEVFPHVKSIFDKIGFKIDYSEFAHTLSFTFLKLEPGQKLGKHTDGFIRHWTSLNIPLTNNCEIICYADKEHRIQYKNPILLDVTKPHAVENNTEEDRIVLKANFVMHTYNQLQNSIINQVNLLDAPAPWKGIGPLKHPLNED